MRERSINPLHKFYFVFLIVLGILNAGCDLFRYTGEEPPPPNILSKKDSLAVRAILDTNGLHDKKVRDVIALQNSIVGGINFDSLTLKQFVFSSAIDSLANGCSINIYYSSTDTILIVDTIHISLTIAIYHTRLKSIPDNISMLKGRLSLYLPNNELQYISPEIMKCNVGYIDVQYNKLCSVSDSLDNWIIKNSRNSDWKNTQICN